MTEAFLHFIWKHKLFDTKELLSTDNEPIEIIHTGFHNHDAGPDFSQAKIKVANTLWAGNVELHLISSDYEKHRHQTDDAYKNVILHVVYEDAQKAKPLPFPTLVLKGRIPHHLIRNHESLLQSTAWIPCAKVIHQVPAIIWQSTFDRLVSERLQRKTNIIFDLLKENKNNWEETFYQLLARNFGMKTNSDSFLELAKRIPVKTLAKHKLSLLQLEALLIGGAGLLKEIFEDAYANQLQQEFRFLQHKHELQPLNATQWKFAKMRPVNFPTIKLAQFAFLIHNANHLFSKIIETEKVDELRKLFDTKVSAYWQQHYMTDKLSVKNEKTLGKNSQDLILINTVVPMLFAYGIWRDEEKYTERAMQILESITAENNSIIKNWKALSIAASNALQTQALLELKNEYCDFKHCESCSIGNKVLMIADKNQD